MKKGFTIIELLGVLTIFAIISLIAVPKILDIVNDSKKESYKISADQYTKAITAEIASRNVTENLDIQRCKINNNQLECYNSKGNIVPIEVVVKN